MKRCISLAGPLCCMMALLWTPAGAQKPEDHPRETPRLVVGTNDSTAYADPEFLPANSTGQIDFAIDAAGFKGAEHQTYVELYLFLRPSQFTLEEQDDTVYRGTFQIDGVIYNEAGAEVQRFSEQRVYETDQPVLIDRKGQERTIVELLPISLDPGVYRIEVTLTDLVSKKAGKCVKPFVAAAFNGESLSISDLQLSTHVQVDTTNHRFSKNNILVLPNPLRIFEKWPEGMTMMQMPKMMYFYFEIYNLALHEDGAPSTFDLSYTIESRTSGMKWTLPGQKDIPKPGPVAVKVLSLDLTSFPPDVYGIEMSVRDNLSGQQAERQAFFEVVQPPPPPKAVTVINEDQAKRALKMLQFVASKQDINLFKKLDLEGKTEFLTNFWKERDPTPDTPENEFLMVFNERFSYAEGQLGGADSDRGRVFMKYGEPEEIERHDSEFQVKPYQIWYYTEGVKGDPSRADSRTGRQFFVFGDVFGVGRYRLLHSTAVGEVNNPSWINELTVSGDNAIRDPNAAYGVSSGSGTQP